MSSPALPLKILETIFDTLAQDDPFRSSLKTCSLVCKLFLELCRKHIYASISIDGRPQLPIPEPTAAAFVRLLFSTPEIADHIRKLYWIILLEDFDEPSLPGTLEKITKLESLIIYWPLERIPEWCENRLRTGILHLMHLPTLLRLEICYIQDFMFTDLIPCIHLRELGLDCTKPLETENFTFSSTFPSKPLPLHRLSFGPGSSTAISKIIASLRPDSTPTLFNLSALPSISFRLSQSDDVEASRQLLQHCSQLTDIDISIDSSPLTWKGLAKMVNPSIATLTRLRFLIYTDDDGTGTNDPLGGLIAELEELRHCQNVIAKMIIDVHVAECSEGDDWGRLDRVLTQSSGWSKLEHPIPETVVQQIRCVPP
ncbi:hypothetical protein M413DRAFT_31573 [Hebeloma cylindrosporum]|uniref:F-box domain-containing protein n=1 Tax=Hebeloma cylindrosporum TaxID=76867 RepID=A0A0C3BYI4_HEBCY|nr:hypothetical protein M413DRAFT_31573 [Hebeloma cylindrosporum h7]